MRAVDANSTKSEVSLGGALSGLLLILIGGVTGALLGALYVRLLVPKTGMGWDQLADALGGLMLGGLLGLVIAVGLCFVLTARRWLWAVLAMTVVSVLVLAGLRLSRPERPVEDPVVREEPFRPWFRVKVRIGHSQEVMLGVERGAEPIPFTEAEVSSGLEELTRIGWGPDFTRCKAEPSREDLDRLLPLVLAGYSEIEAGHCRTDSTNDLGVVLGISMAEGRRGGRVDSDCLPRRPALVALAGEVAEIAQSRCPTP